MVISIGYLLPKVTILELSSWLLRLEENNYLCSGNLSFKSFRFVNSDPILIGSDAYNKVYNMRLLADRFEIKFQSMLSGISSNDMFLYDSNDSSDTSDCLVTLSTYSQNYVLVFMFSNSDGSILNNNELNYQITNLKINYSNKGKDYVISGYISLTNQLVVMRFDLDTFSFNDLRITAPNNQANYYIIPGTVIIDSDANIMIGGNVKSANLMIYKAGEDLSLYSCIYSNSTRINSETIAKTSLQIYQSASYISLSNNNANSNWDNKTGRVFGYDK